LKLQKITPLQWALGVSIAIHAVLLTVRFVDPQAFDRVFQDTPLEVTLINAKSNEVPDAAKVIAQFSMAGGGDAEKGRGSSPVPPSALVSVGESLEDETTRKLQNFQQHQAFMRAQVKDMLAALSSAELEPTIHPTEIDKREEKRRQLIKQLAEIEQRINMENAWPKKHFVAPNARGEAYAVYYDALRHAIESKGTENFPQSAGKKLYGELIMIVTVNHDGQVISTEIVQSSGNKTLDRRAQTIARKAGPFGYFTKAMRKKADQLVMVARFNFTRDKTLETTVSSQQ
jgi:periplasmic protein TonB